MTTRQRENGLQFLKKYICSISVLYVVNMSPIEMNKSVTDRLRLLHVTSRVYKYVADVSSVWFLGQVRIVSGRQTTLHIECANMQLIPRLVQFFLEVRIVRDGQTTVTRYSRIVEFVVDRVVQSGWTRWLFSDLFLTSFQSVVCTLWICIFPVLISRPHSTLSWFR